MHVYETECRRRTYHVLLIRIYIGAMGKEICCVFKKKREKEGEGEGKIVQGK